MRNAILAAMAVILVTVWAIPVCAEPTILGPTGLFVNPTADITQVNHAWIAINFFDNNGNSLWTANVTGSLTDAFEVGIGAIHPEEGDDGISVFGKWLVFPERENVPGIAVGTTVTNIAGDQASYIYAVASKFFYLGSEASESASLHGGITYIDIGKGDERDNKIEWFAGGDLELTKNLFIIGEYLNDQDMTPFDGWTYGARYYFDLHTTGQAAIIDGDLHFGASFIF